MGLDPLARGHTLRSRFLTAAVLLAACTSTEPGPGGSAPPLEFLAGTAVDDTVDAKPVQAVVVRVRDAGAGVTVRFEGGGAPAPYVNVSGLADPLFSEFVAGTTNPSGEAAVRVQLGTKPGTAWLRVLVPELGLSDSVAFLIRPGLVATVQGTPSDTLLLPGASFALRGSTVDRYGNARDDPVMLTALDATVSVAGGTITAERPGLGRVQLEANGITAIVKVLVVPDGVLVALAGPDIVAFRTDGTILRRMPSPGPAGVFTSDYSAGRHELVYDLASCCGLRAVGLDNVARDITTGHFDIYPEFSVDGAWIYYSREGFRWTIRRIRPDGTGDEEVLNVAQSTVGGSPSPDLMHVAYVVPGPDELFVYDVASGTSRQISASGHTPAWSPAGDQIAYVAPQTGQLRLVSPTGAGDRAVGTPFHLRLGIDWSRDAAWVVASDQGSLVLIEVATGATLPLGYSAGWTAPSWQQLGPLPAPLQGGHRP